MAVKQTLVNDVLRPALHAAVGLVVIAAAAWVGLTATETGQAIVTTVELVQEVTVEVQQANGGLRETVELLNDILRLGRELLQEATP